MREAPVGALELMGMGVALVLDQSQLADPPIGLAQPHPKLLGQAHQPLARPVEQLGAGREHHRLRAFRSGADPDLALTCLRAARASRRSLSQTHPMMKNRLVKNC